MENTTQQTPVAGCLYTVRNVRGILKVGHTKVYDLIKRGQLDAVHLGKSTRITGASLLKIAEAGAP